MNDGRNLIFGMEYNLDTEKQVRVYMFLVSEMVLRASFNKECIVNSFKHLVNRQWPDLFFFFNWYEVSRQGG